MMRIVDSDVVKLYCVRLPKWYVHACVGCPDVIRVHLCKSEILTTKNSEWTEQPSHTKTQTNAKVYTCK